MSDPTPKSFGKSLFFGDIPEDMVFPYPQLDPRERNKVADLVAGFHRFARETGPDKGPGIDSRRIDDSGHIPDHVRRGLSDLGLLGLIVPTPYGGLGLSNTAFCRVFQEVAAVDASVALMLAGHLSLGCRSLDLFGTPEQKQRFLPRLARGEALCAFCLTEPHSGSDAAAIRTRATLKDDGFLLSGSKLWVTNGGIADVFVLFAQTEVVRDGTRVDRITSFLVERGMGVRSGAEEGKLGVRGASTTALYLDEVKVPRDNVLHTVGGGFKVAMETLNSGRLSLSAGCVGMAKEVLRLSLQHATSRRQFGRLISSFGMIKDKLARMQVDIYAAESMLYLTTGLHDRSSAGSDHALESACCKVFCSEMLWRVVNQAMQIAAGCGYMHDYPYERLLRDSRLHLIFGGTNEILRCFIALTGMQGPGEHLAKLADAIKYPLRGYGLVVDSLLDKVKVAAYGSAAITQHHGRLKKEAVNIEDAVEALAKGIDRALRRHGRQISEMQYVQGRVADVMIDLYAMIACVSRTSLALSAGQGVKAPGRIDDATDDADRELRLCRGFCGKAHARIQEVLGRFNENDDELMKTIADDSYHGRPYPFDAVLG